jgi:phi13 family phage major tail protein
MALAVRPRFGGSDVVYAILDEATDIAGGTPTYGTVYPLANAIKIGVNPNGSGATLFADDAARLIATTPGKIDVDIELADILPSAYATILGHSYTGGAIIEKSTDSAPYIAIGFKSLRSGKDGANLVYDYFWIYKGKMIIPTDSSDTKKDSINFQNVVLKGLFVSLISDNSYRMRLRTDDPAAGATLITNFFAQVTLVTADTGALSVTISQGAAAHLGDVKLVFAKVGGGSFNLSAGCLDTNGVIVINQTDDDEVILPGVFSTPAAGTTVTVYFTPTTAITSTDAITIVVTNTIVDNSGIHCTPKSLLISSWT